MKLSAILACAASLALMPGIGTQLQARTQANEAQDWSAPTSQRMVSVEGGRVWVRINGKVDEGGTPVIFIHGGPGGTHAGFGGLISLADQRAVILYDQLDSGMSDRPEDPANWRVERFVDELEAIRQSLGVERWHLVGHSWGAALALEYAARFPQHTASSVLAGPYISTPHWIMGTSLLLRKLPDEIAATIIACQREGAQLSQQCEEAETAFSNAYNGRPDRPAPSAAALAYYREYSGRGWNQRVYNAMWGPNEFTARGMLIDYDATALLSRIDGSRTMFLLGQYDEARIDDVQEFMRLAPGAELAVVPGGSHAFPAERPDITEAILRSWLTRIDARDAAGEESE